ncbi:hypothetical protein N7504_002496 [Penicillium tannophilum]|nr:hypothetical protein N7504_002496 [Penicillium tannophilum]
MAGTTQAPATTCAEHIALSSFFYHAPAPVTRNPVNPSSIDQERYILPFSKERALTEVLAFLAKTKDGSDHIPAVCVEQAQSGTTLNVILAINKRHHTDGDGLLQKLKINFEEIFRLLDISQYDNSEVQRKVFASIISMCSPRVLCRLGLERKATRRPIHHLLKDAIYSIRQIHPQKLRDRQLHSVSSSFIAEANKVIQLVDRWSKHQTLDELCVIVEGINHLQQTAPQFHHLLALISNIDMVPSSRSSLLNIIRKVSRYWDAARHLYRTAKKFLLVRKMKVQLATLPLKAFEGQIDCSVFSDLDLCLSRHGFIKEQQDSVSQLCHKLNIDEKAAHARYGKACMALSAPKIHAEIQIVAFCDMQSRGLFPRVVSSSKDACFLCNTFIQLHKRMHIPRAHGRLWPGWKLPTLPQFTVLQQNFNERLLEDLHRNVSSGLARAKLHVHPIPSESNLLTLTASVTTQSIPKLASETSHENTSSIASSSIVSDNPPINGPLSAIGQIPRIEAPSDSSINTVHLLEEKKPMKDYLKHSRSFRLIITESLEVHLGLDDESTSATTKEPLGYIIERLEADKIKSLSEKCPVFDVRRLEGEVSCLLSEENSFCLVAGDVVLKITTQKSIKDN